MNKIKTTKLNLRRIKDEVKDIKIDTDDNVKSTELQLQQGLFKKQSKKKFYKLGFGDRRKLKAKTESSYLITMMFNNGTLKTFVISTNSQTFKVRKKLYYLYFEESWYDISMNLYHLYFTESSSVPINREISMNGKEAFYSVTPDNLEPLIKFEYVKVLAGSHSFDKMLRTILVVSFINIVIGVITLLMNFGGGQPV